MLVRDRWNQRAQILEERYVVRDRVAIGQDPVLVREREIDQARHIIPAAEIETKQMLAQVVGELLELVRHRMSFAQCHRLELVLRTAFERRQRLKDVAPPQCLFGGLGFRNINAERMAQLTQIQLEDEQREIEERSRGDLARIDAGLRHVQTAHARPDHRRRRLDADPLAAFLVLVAQLAVEGGDHVVEREQHVPPLVDHRVLEVEHDARRAGVEHLHDELGLIGGSRHLIALVLAPGR
jgi:hypothetical protein